LWKSAFREYNPAGFLLLSLAKKAVQILLFKNKLAG